METTQAWPEGGCIYCGLSYGWWVVYRGRNVVLRREVDHLIPRSYWLNNSPSNLVDSCQICNRAKSNKIFDSIEDARAYVQAKTEGKIQAGLPPMWEGIPSEANRCEVLQCEMPMEQLERTESSRPYCSVSIARLISGLCMYCGNRPIVRFRGNASFCSVECRVAQVYARQPSRGERAWWHKQSNTK